MYNTDEIKVAARIDNNLTYTYEMSIPLKYLKEHIADKFSYDVRINGIDTREKIQYIRRDGHPDIVLFESGRTTYMIGRADSPETMFNAYSTDFWGEYNIALK